MRTTARADIASAREPFQTNQGEIQMLTKRSRSGFTLPEILVTVTVIAVLAAVVVPAVTQYASRGDAPSAKSDVLQLSTSITGFASDVRYYPGDLRQLTTKIATVGTGLTAATATPAHNYTASDIAKWVGPYTPSTLNGSGYATLAGFQVQVGPTLSFSTPPQWLEAQIQLIAGAALSCPALLALDAAVDGSTNVGNEGSTGQIQWDVTGTPCSSSNTSGTFGTAYLRLIPAP
jgi:prepilin-type N-terminal cleavage/methylation domain-containing protein